MRLCEMYIFLFAPKTAVPLSVLSINVKVTRSWTFLFVVHHAYATYCFPSPNASVVIADAMAVSVKPEKQG